MKKFIALIMVLGICSVATATVTYDVVGDATPGGSFTIQVNGLKGDMDWSEGLYTDDQSQNGGTMDIEGSTVHDGSGEVLEGYLTTNLYYASFDGVDMAAKESASVEPGSGNGTWFTIDVSVSSSAKKDDVQTFDRLDWGDEYAELGTFDVTVVPEPATMALLGLGGLFLRKRRTA